MSFLSAITDLLKPAAPPDPAVAAALDRVIGMVDPLVRAAPRLDKHLLGAVEHALGYCQGLVAALPGPIQINRQAFGNDSLVHALFATANDIDDMLGRSQAVRDFLEKPECWRSDCFCAMLAARRQQKKHFGMAQQGSIIRADVPQEVLFFSDQTLIEPSCDLEMTRSRLQARALESLLQSFNAHVEALRRERQGLRANLSAEHAQLAAWQHSHPLAEHEAQTRHLVELDLQLRHNDEALMPENLVDLLADFLRHPESALSLTPVSIRIDRLGIVHDANADDDAQTISFPELSSRDRRQHLATLVRVSRDEARAAVDKSRNNQQRYIII